MFYKYSQKMLKIGQKCVQAICDSDLKLPFYKGLRTFR